MVLPRVVRAPALIVGGGPVGLYCSSLLSAFGVPSLLVDRASQPSQHPRAHLINTRSMELLRELGVGDEILAQTPEIDEWRHFRYCTSVLGQQIAAQDHIGGASSGHLWKALRESSPSRMCHLSQPKLETILRRDAESRAEKCGSRLLFGFECVKFEQNTEGVRAYLRRAAGRGEASDAQLAAVSAAMAGSKDDLELQLCEAARNGETELTVEASQMLACDGAHSPVRRALGLPLRGPPPLQHFKSIHFRAPQLWDATSTAGSAGSSVMERPAMLYFVFNRHAIAVLVAHNLREGEWVAQIPFFPGLQRGEELDAITCEAIIRECIGDPSIEIEVRSTTNWAMSAKVAQRLTAGRIHLLGDAAHQFPPAGAFGANTGLQDAHNLCWKVGAVHHGAADAALLRSYDAERRPVALANARLAVHNYHRGLRVAEALGLPAAVPRAVADAALELRAALPPPLAKAVHALEGGGGSRLLDAGRRALIDLAGHVAGHALGAQRLQAAQRVVDSGAALPLLFGRHELGYLYNRAGAAVANDDRAEPQETCDIEDETYKATTRVGARLPHHVMQADGGRSLSSHDLLHLRPNAASGQSPAQSAATSEPPQSAAISEPPQSAAGEVRLAQGEPPRLTLLVDEEGLCVWGGAALQIHSAQVPRVVAVLRRSAPSEAAAHLHVEASRLGVLVVTDACGGWPAKSEVSAGGALLVRPDGHVAWRCSELEAEGTVGGLEAAEALRRAVRLVLGEASSQM